MESMKSRPILFSGPMVRALLDGSKTQTRRAVKKMDNGRVKMPGSDMNWHLDDSNCIKVCPYGQPGDQLWVQENHRLRNAIEETESVECNYSEDGEQQMIPLQNREFVKLMCRENRVGADYGATIPGRFMYKSLSRITLEITAIRCERLHDISEADAIAEGIDTVIGQHKTKFCRYRNAVYSSDGVRVEPEDCDCGGYSYVEHYGALWEKINGPGSWDTNPFVWVVEFRRIEQ